MMVDDSNTGFLSEAAAAITDGTTALGIELGSTRIKAVLVDSSANTLSSATYDWQSKMVDGHWSYALEDVWTGIQTCFARLSEDVLFRYEIPLKRVGYMGISAMMHGYLAFDENGKQLVPFRTWRDTTTGEACEKLIQEFQTNIPHRWSVAHYYQAMLNGEEHVSDVRFLTTLSGYVHWKLTGEKILGIGDASGMFPIELESKTYDSECVKKFGSLTREFDIGVGIDQLLPRVACAGEYAGKLTEEGATLLDPTGVFQPGAEFCPPEGDAGTGMTATNAIMPRTGNVSVGTSLFAMIVLESPIKAVYREIDLVCTPDGKPVAMVHCNNGSADLNAWVMLFQEVLRTFGKSVSPDELYSKLLNISSEGRSDGGGLISYNYIAGEPITGVETGTPMFLRKNDSEFNLANFMQSQLMGVFATLRIGMDILTGEEGVAIDYLLAHGGLFKTPVIAQQTLADALGTPIAVGENAGEGGAWGMAVLALFNEYRDAMYLQDYLNSHVFRTEKSTVLDPKPEGTEGFAQYLEDFKSKLPAQEALDVQGTE